MEFRLLGPLEVRGDDGMRIALGGKRPRSLLALLLLHPNEAVSTDRLIDGIWGESPPASALGALQVHVHALRKVLGADRIVTRPPGYLVRVGQGELDVERFELLVPSGEPDALREALALWRGPALADLAYEGFARAEATRLDESRLSVLEARIAADLDAGRHTDLVGELEALVAVHPHRERLQAQRMLALYRSGRHADALAAYRDARAALDELGLEPSPELRTLERRILEHDPALSASASRVAPRGAPAPQLIGRDLELTAMAALLGRSDVRLVTLTGAGGTGKTALARAVAAPHPHVFVDLAPLTDPSLVLRTIAGAIGVDEDPDEELLDLVADALRTDPPLLVLDNLEHLAGAFGDVAALLVAAPATRILATSRTSLRLALEHEYRVEPLAVPALELTDVEELRRNASVQLYVERAHGSAPTFELTEANAHHVARICRALDGLPLAVELAAARVRVLGPEGTARRLGESLALLSREAVDVPERHRSLRATIAWSYDLLDDAARSVFGALFVYPGGATLDALEATCDETVVVPDALEQLLDTGLVASRLTPAGEPRFSMHATIRAFAATLFEEDGGDAALRDRQVAYFLALLRTAQTARRDDPTAFARIVTGDDRDNLRAALTHAAAAGLGDELLELCGSLTEYWRTSGAIDEGEHWLEESLARSPEGDPRQRGRVLLGLALLGYVRGRPDEAIDRVGLAIELLDRHGQPEELARALWLRGAAAHNLREFELARNSYEPAIELFRRAGYEATAGRVIGSLAEAHRRLGDLGGARDAALESAAIAERNGDPEPRAYALAHVACYELGRGDREGAARAIAEALRVAVDGGGLWATAIGLLYASQVTLAYDVERETALLLGSAHAAFDSVGEDRWSFEEDDWGPVVEELERRLGPDLAALLDEGRGLPPDEAAQLALLVLPE